MHKQRILYIDILKLFTIYLVIWGHAIMHFQPDYRHSIIFQFIYSFHMPLFMMLSGYFAVSSMELDIKTFFLKKFRQLLLPCISWGIICWLLITSGLIEGRFHLNLRSLFTAGWIGLFDNFWFLKSCFICYTLSWVCWRCGRYKLPAMLLVWGLCTLQGRFHLNMMFPCFLLGMYLRHSSRFKEGLSTYVYIPIIVFLVLFVCKILDFHENYITKLFLGATGALSCFELFKKYIGALQPSPFLKKLAKLGGITLGVYVLQAILLEFLAPRYFSFDELPLTAITLLMPVISVFAFMICWAIIKIINKSDLLACLMFGHEYKYNEIR